MAAILEVRDLAIEFKTDRGTVRAVDGVDFELKASQALGIVGESGCGKSVTAMAIMGLLPYMNGRMVRGSVVFDGKDLSTLSERDYRKIRGQALSMIFQDPMTSLNPVYSVGKQMMQVLDQHRPSLSRKTQISRCLELIDRVGLKDPEKSFHAYPHELSGGMRQRVMIAMALLCEPKILIADEPTTALDVTTQAQILKLIRDLQKDSAMALILVTHDMGVIAESVEQLMVMYCGKVVEKGSVKYVLKNPMHPYSRGLLDSIPVVRSSKLDRLPVIPGIVPDLMSLPQGCRFADRCMRVRDECRSHLSPIKALKDQHVVSCLFPLSKGELL